MSAPLLSRERIVAPPGWSRWLVPPAALAIHLSIVLLVDAFVCNELIRVPRPSGDAVDRRGAKRARAEDAAGRPGERTLLGVIAWLWVGLLFLHGLIQLIAKIPALFSV